MYSDAATLFLLLDARGGRGMSTKQADIEREMREDGHLWGDPENWWRREDSDTHWQQYMMEQEREDGGES